MRNVDGWGRKARTSRWKKEIAHDRADWLEGGLVVTMIESDQGLAFSGWMQADHVH
jgi:hypothetical protein